MMFQRIVLVHSGREEAVALAGQAEKLLRRRGAEVIVPDAETEIPTPDLILTFGGDGTLLAGARQAMRQNAPLLGFNLGTVGFLTEEEPGRLEQALEALWQGDFQMDDRSLLAVKSPFGTDLALNDAVITRGGFARLIRVDSFVNEELQDIYTADGVIVATPTGSTGYSLSAGGPVVEPGMNCMILTPVCPHSLKHCPTVLSAQSVVRLRLQKQREQTAELQIDGQNRGMLKAGDQVIVQGTDQKIRLIRLHPYSFFHLMREKLSEW